LQARFFFVLISAGEGRERKGRHVKPKTVTQCAAVRIAFLVTPSDPWIIACVALSLITRHSSLVTLPSIIFVITRVPGFCAGAETLGKPWKAKFR
jgi:hypothetical protein